jgi:putative endonuclease
LWVTRLTRNIYRASASRFPAPPRATSIFSFHSPSLFWAVSGTRTFVPSVEWEDLRQIRGLWGERAALGYLVSCGWDIEAHRFKLGRHDVDLIARRGNMVAFVEVKTRRSVTRGTPVESVNQRKQSIIAKVASVWCLRYGRAKDEYRFDVVAVHQHSAGQYTIEHVEDAWRCCASSRRRWA